jgi:WD40 repeat protein
MPVETFGHITRLVAALSNYVCAVCLITSVDHVQAGQTVCGAQGAQADAYGDPLPVGSLARLGTVRLRHGSNVHSVAFTPDGKLIASADRSCICLWDAANGRLCSRFEARRNNSFVFAPDGKTLLFDDWDHAFVLDVASGNRLQEFALPKGTSASHVCRFTSDGQTVVTATDQSGPRNGYSPTYDPLHGVPSEERIQLDHWNVDSGQKQLTTTVAARLESGATISPVPKRRGKANLLTIHDKLIKCWATETGKVTVTFDGHSKGVYHVAVSPDGKVVASVSYDDTLKLWDVESGKQLWSVAAPPVESLIFSADGTVLMGQASNGALHLLDVASGRVVRQILGKREGAVAVSPDNKLIATSESSSIHLWDLVSGEEVLHKGGHRHEVQSVAFTGDGKSLVSGGGDGAVFFWPNMDPTKRQLLTADMGYVFSVVCAPTCSLVAASGRNGTCVWEGTSGKLIGKQRGVRGEAAFSLDCKTLAVVDAWEFLCTWSIDANTVRRYFTGKYVESSGVSRNSGVLSHDLKVFVEIGMDGQVIVREIETGQERSRIVLGANWFFHGYGAQFAPDNSTLALVVSRRPEDKVFFVDVTKARILRSVPCRTAPRSVAFSPDGHMLAADDYGSITLIETASAKVRLHWDGHLGHINSFTFSPDGKVLATASDDGTMLLWKLDRLVDNSVGSMTLSDKQLASLWADLGSEDAAIAYRAIMALHQDPNRGTAFLLEKMEDLWRHYPKDIKRLIADLGNERYDVRKKAEAELASLEDTAGPALHAALAKKPALEVSLRLENLLKKLDPLILSQRQLIVLRTMEVLQQHAATPEVHAWLKKLANGPPEARLTLEARLALEHMKK